MGVSQKNKGHKPGRNAGLGRRHRFKQSDGDTKGRVTSKAASAGNSRMDRTHKAKQAREQHRKQLIESKHKERTYGPPKTVMVLPLSDAVECGAVLQGLASSAECPLAPTMMCVQHKLRASFLTPDRRDVRACLDACKAADAVLLLSPQQCSLDATAHSMLTLLRLQGMPAPCVALLGLGATAPMNVKAAAKKTAMSALEMYNPDTKVVAVEGATECMEVWRFLSTSKPHAPAWRAVRPWVLAERLRYVPDAATAVESGELHVTGFVRGGALCADQLVHIGGCDYQIARIEGPAEPVPFRLREKANGMQTEASAASPTLARPTEAQEALIVENEVDNLAGEQTWPTEEEMADAEREAAANRKAKTTRVPKGTSQYQAAWLDVSDSEGEDEEAESDEEEQEDTSMLENIGQKLMDAPEDEMGGEIEEEEEEEEEGEAVAEETEEEHRAAAQAAMLERRKAREQEDLEFPDEMDTPLDVPARKRFEKYRGLKSFRTTPWDPKESLPVDYARIFAFANLKRAMKKAKATQADVELRTDSLCVGTYVTVVVARVPAAAAAAVLELGGAAKGVPEVGAGVVAAHPVVLSALLQHESKLTVLHMTACKSSTCQEPIRSKDAVVVSVGFRTFTGQPIYSVDSHNMDKHKVERFLHPGAMMMASFYAPITFPPAPVLAFRPESGGRWEQLLWSGSLRGADPDRINLKRVILSGVPHKVHKRKSLVQFMFHTPEDVRYFRPCELWTKWGRRGRIKEPVGTHGRMKCLFDAVIQQRDTICISIYKRVYPPFPKPQ